MRSNFYANKQSQLLLKHAVQARLRARTNALQHDRQCLAGACYGLDAAPVKREHHPTLHDAGARTDSLLC